MEKFDFKASNQIEILSIENKIIRTVEIIKKTQIIDLSDLPAQLYFYKMKSNNQVIDTGKLIIY